MLQRNAGPQSQTGLAAPGHTEGARGEPHSLPAPSVPAEKTVVGEQHLVFSLLDREFALQAEYIQGVERLADVTVIPHVASWVAGVINLRGSISSVVDLRTFLEREKLPYNPRTRLLSVKYNEMLICLVVDSVSEMVPIAPNTIDSTMHDIPSWVVSYASGMAMVGKRRVILLDAARLLFADKMHHYST
ncbi:MAG: chemotaxis protein CheW [Ktedonobacteraceae bacterium]